MLVERGVIYSITECIGAEMSVIERAEAMSPGLLPPAKRLCFQLRCFVCLSVCLGFLKFFIYN